MIIALNQQHLTQLIYGKERVKSHFSVHWHVEWSLSESVMIFVPTHHHKN